MFKCGYLCPFAAFVVFAGILTTPAAADDLKSAAKLSEALGGSLRDGMIDADGAGYGNLDTVPLRPGRGEEYRLRVARDAAQSHFATSAH